MFDAVAILAERKISELPVIDLAGRPVGLIDITDVVGLFPEAQHANALESRGAASTPPAAGPPRPKHPLLHGAAAERKDA